MSHEKMKRAVLAGVLGALFLLAGIVPFQALSGQMIGQPQTPPQTAPQNPPPGQATGQPANPQAATPQVQAPPPQVQLSILLLMDVSGTMGDNNKIDQAKEAAIRSISSALKATTPSLTQAGAQTVSAITPIPIGPHTPGIPVEIVKKFDRNLEALQKLQDVLGKDIRKWIGQREAAEMGKIFRNCEELMEGLAFGQKSELMKRLSPLVEKMHYSIAAEVNNRLGGGLQYVLPGKTPSNPEFGGLFTLKPSDHDAIYLGAGEKADEAAKLHRLIAEEIYGKNFLTTTESCLESSRFTLEKLAPEQIPAAYQKFSGSQSNLDWMRTKSGGKWVQEYVDKAGKVVDPTLLDDAADTAKAMRGLNTLTQKELETLGVTMDRGTLQGMGYNLGLQSDFERQLALNQARKALEKGLTAATTEDTAMLMAKYSPRLGEVAEGAGVRLDGTPWKGYLEQVTAVGKKAKEGLVPLDAADKAVLSRFQNFNAFVRDTAVANQARQYGNLKNALTQAMQRGDTAGAAAIESQLRDVLDDAQGALHNFQQLYGNEAANKVIQQVSQTQDEMGKALTQRLVDKPWISPEPNLTSCVEKELALQGKLPAPGASVPTKMVIPDAKTMWEYTKANPGHVFAKVAQYGAYAYVFYDINSLLKDGKYDEAIRAAEQFGGMEAVTFFGGKLMQAKFGAFAGAGVALAGTIGYAIGDAIAQSMINGKVSDMSLSMMSGLGKDGNPAYQGQGKGFLETLASAKMTKFENPASGQADRWIDFNAPSEAANLSDDQIMSMIKPGTYGDTTVTVDANGRVTYTKDKGMKWVIPSSGYGMEQVPDIEVTSYDKNQIIAHQRLQMMYQAMKEKYNTDMAGGGIGTDSGQVPGSFRYTDPYAKFPGSEFDIPNTGGMSLHEFTYYRMMFDRSYNKWALDKNPDWVDTAYWGNTQENAYKAKWEMFRQFMANMSESKVQDRKFQEKLESDSPEDLAALKILAEQGFPFWVDGKKLTPEDIQKRIDKKLEDRQKILDAVKNGVVHIQLPADLEKLLNELSAMASGNVEIGIMPYSGGCGDTFSLFGFSQNANDLNAAINGLSAGGGTPMSPALYQARHAILAYGTGKTGLIILLCDGQNDCSENPVKAADNIRQSTFPANPGGVTRLIREIGDELGKFQLFPVLYAQTPAPAFVKIDMKKPIPAGREKMPISVSTVGFQVTADQQKVLDEIAKAGGGISGSAQNIDQLTTAFTSAIQTAAQSIPFGGGGGGGVVAISSRFNWMTGALIALAVLIVCLGMGILIVRSRRQAGAGPVAAAGAPVYAIFDVYYPDGGTKSFPVSGSTTIGRAEGNVLVLHDDMVSSRHAELVVSQQGYLLRDLGSANGTFVNGRQVAEQYLASGDQIQMGQTTLTFRGN